MSKNLGETINNIMEENSTNRVLILTNHLQITGRIHEYKEECENCHNCLVTLKNAKIARIEELCNCSENECECHIPYFAEYDWFNINTSSIVGFSIIK